MDACKCLHNKTAIVTKMFVKSMLNKNSLRLKKDAAKQIRINTITEYDKDWYQVAAKWIGILS